MLTPFKTYLDNWLTLCPYAQYQYDLEQDLIQLEPRFQQRHNLAFQMAYHNLPSIEQSYLIQDQPAITVASKQAIAPSIQQGLRSCLKQLGPWRKGPFDYFGLFIDSEWQCQLKWERLKPALAHLKQMKVADVGCGNGYYMFRLLEYPFGKLIGFDPTIQFYYQYLATQRYLKKAHIQFLPLGFKALTYFPCYFDYVLCMGVLYHHPYPYELLKIVKNALNKGGTLVLDTLIIEGDDDLCLSPRHRYAGMKHVYFLPTLRCLETWLKRVGFKQMTVINTTYTTSEEQRSTAWSAQHSLKDVLDKKDKKKTIEGYQAPLRAIVVVEK